MPALFTRIGAMARSPQGRRMAQQAMRYARSPEGKRRVAALRQRAGRRPPR